MELTVNLFNKGLLLDLYPMVQGNDVLSDCLNGTMITMSGNEVVLQNDMGNRRIDNAFLPVGYEPVGIKEYGGIIYVAAYNPITNKSLIGSFPSPERKINHLDDSNLKGELNLSDLNKSYNKNGINYLTRDSLLIPLTKDTSLHAGDKFVVYGSVDSSNITNYNNSYSNKAKTPKNKLYTLALGVLNSLNEFVDITKTLVRWNGNSIIKFGEDATDIYKFNTGYFIASSLPDDLSNMTLDDLQLLLERLKCPANTYSYKLVGPLYLKATLNHISGFNYNIYGIKNGDTGNNYTIWIEADITYNCPDGINISDTDNNGNEYYKSFEEGDVTFNAFALYHDGSIVYSSEIVGSKATKYDPTTNLYSVKIVKKYSIGINEGQTYKYTIAVDSGVSGVYLEGLSNSGEIDPLLLGSNTVKINEWRFSNNYEKQETTLTYSFNAYPEYGKTFDNLLFKFIPYEKDDDENWDFNEDNEKTIPGQLYNGRVTTQLSWNAAGLEPRTLYKVEYSYNEVENGSIAPKTSTEAETRWFLTTELFNECYNLSLDTGVKDFGKKDENSHYNEHIEDLLEVVYALDANADGLISDSREFLSNDSTTILVPNSNNSVLVKYTKEYDLEINLDYEVLINETLYPNFILKKSNLQIISSNEVTIEDIKLETSNIGHEIISGSGYNSPFNLDYQPKFKSGSETTEKYLIKRTLVTLDIFASNAENTESSLKYIENGFISLIRNYAVNYKTFLGNKMRYATTFIDFKRVDDMHWVAVSVETSENNMNIDRWGNHHDVYESEKDYSEYLYYNNIRSLVNDILNTLPNDVIFTWAFSNHDGNLVWFTNVRDKTDDDGGDKNCNIASRVWWRTSQNTWAVCYDLIDNVTNGFRDFMKRLFKLEDGTLDYKFAYYKTVYLSDLNLKYPGKNLSRTVSYSQPATISWKTKVANYEGVFEKVLQNDLLLFSIDSKSSENSYIVNIATPEAFEDIVSIRNNSIFKNIDIETLLSIDFFKNELDPNKIYSVKVNPSNSKDENLLIPYNTYDFIVSDYAGNNRAIVYNKVDYIGTPIRKFDVRGADLDSMTNVDYSGANIAVL